VIGEIMTTHNLADALIGEHREIDAGIEEFLSALENGDVEADPLTRAFDALRRHVYLEEELLFPPIRRAGLLMPLMVMAKEHGELWQAMDAIEEHLREGDPGDASLRSACQRLLAGLDQHNSKEEPIIYPHAVTDLTSHEEDLLADFIASGAMPSDWLCEALR
jgi:hemerythrin-like domain-containing protein